MVIGIAVACLLVCSCQKNKVMGERKFVQSLIRNGDIIANAIRRFHERKKRYPHRLEELKPNFLVASPPLGIEVKDGWFYTTRDDPFYGGWSLWVEIKPKFSSSRFSFGDVIAYHPSHRYHEEGYGGKLERIGNWAYYHE